MSDVIHKFTRRVPQWRPRVAPVKLEDATESQLAALQVTPSNTKVSDYLLVLAHDVEILQTRSPLFNAIMYDKGGLSRAERELGALGASVVNHCIYCAAVHAERHAQLTRSEQVTDEIFQRGDAANLEKRDAAIYAFSRKLSETPPSIDKDDINRLLSVGLNPLEIQDLVLSTALFGWANRLMHVLGDPVSTSVPDNA